MDPYNYTSIIAVKILVQKNDEFLLLREPETNAWMPGRLGLPGGKLLANESLLEAVDRKIETEIGFKITIKGLVRIIDIKMPEKKVYHFVFLAEYVQGEIDLTKIEAADMRWFSRPEINGLSVNDCTEYYTKQVLDDVQNENYSIVPTSLLSPQDNTSGEIKNWMEKGSAQ